VTQAPGVVQPCRIVDGSDLAVPECFVLEGEIEDCVSEAAHRARLQETSQRKTILASRDGAALAVNAQLYVERLRQRRTLVLLPTRGMVRPYHGAQRGARSDGIDT
jgi:hypothetical protein